MACVGNKSGEGTEVLREVGLRRSLGCRHASGEVDSSHAPNTPPLPTLTLPLVETGF